MPRDYSFDWMPQRTISNPNASYARTYPDPIEAIMQQQQTSQSSYEKMYEDFLRQQQQLGNRGLDIKQGLLEGLAPAIMRLLGGGFAGGGSFSGGGGGYQTDYGAGIYSPMQMTQGGYGQASMARPPRRFGSANYVGDMLGR